MMNADTIVAAVRSRGSDTNNDVRDAAGHRALTSQTTKG